MSVALTESVAAQFALATSLSRLRYLVDRAWLVEGIFAEGCTGEAKLPPWPMARLATARSPRKP